MSTVEDVFHLYENHNNKDKIILPLNIGEQDIGKQNIQFYLKYKCYIKPGDICPICLDEIYTKSSAFLTNCGHHFHKKCLFNYMKKKWESNNYAVSCRCPNCRRRIGNPEFYRRYKNSYFDIEMDEKNELDKLEDLWLSLEYKLPEFCSNGLNHYLGTNKECSYCVLYRNTGKIIFDFS